MFRTNNYSSSGGLYNQLTVSFHAFYEQSCRCHAVTILTGFSWAGIAYLAQRIATARTVCFRDRIPVDTRFSAPAHTGP